MQIAIVDDFLADAKLLQSFVSCWAKEQQIPLVPPLQLFSNGDVFLKTFAAGKYDIIFLDIYMDGINGMEVAHKIRQQDKVCRLIFTTSATEYAVESYEVQAAYYLVKPYSYQKLCQALEQSNANLLEKGQSILVPGLSGKQRLYLHQITYTEYSNRYIYVHFLNKEPCLIPMRQTDFASLLLNYPYFCDCMRGILINFEMVDKLLEDRFLLKDGASIPISRLKYREVREKFLEYSYAQVRGGA